MFSGLRDRREARRELYDPDQMLAAVLLSMQSGVTSLRKADVFIDERLGWLTNVRDNMEGGSEQGGLRPISGRRSTRRD